MKIMTVGECKTHFSDVIIQVKSGEKIAVTYGKKREIVGYFLPGPPAENKRILVKQKFTFNQDFKITEEEFLGL